MRKRGFTGSFWPSSDQELLLRAALLGQDRALPAWQELRPRLDLDRLEQGSYALMPLVYRMLQDAGADEPLLPRLKGLYRHTWSKNKLLLSELGDALDALGARDVEALAIGGASRLSWYPEPGLRPMTERELLVLEQDAETAQLALGALGWACGTGPLSTVVSRKPSARFHRGGGRALVLHWRLLPEFAVPGAPVGDAPFWDGTRPLELAGHPAKALDPADELLHTCVSGARTALWANVQWIADAALIVRSAELSWERLVEHALAYRACVRLREALEYVSSVTEAEVPQHVLTELARVPATRRELLAHRASSVGGRLMGEFPRTVAHYLRASENDGPLRSIARFPAHLRETWALRSSWQIPFSAARKGAAALAGRAGRRRVS